MIKLTENAEAQRVFDIFEEISAIPRGSGNTAKIADYLEGFAKARSLEYYRDGADNVIIKKPATEGLADRPTVILQGHTDMVLQAASGSVALMEKEGVKIVVDGDFIRADGTTLGADNGIAVAYALAILDSKNIAHPNIEAVFTSDEEIGLIGAAALDCSKLEGKIMLNIDSDEEGVFTAGCAGGRRVDITLPVSFSGAWAEKYTLILDGLKGGHSGVEIDKGRTNAAKRIAEYLSNIEGVRLVSLSGGVADNAIPASASAEFVCSLDMNALFALTDRIKSELPADAEHETLTLLKGGVAEQALTEEDSKRLISLICALPCGIVNMSEDIEGQVETSLNLGILRLSESEAAISFSLRSSKEAKKHSLSEEVEKIARSFGAEVSTHGDYPGWDYKKESLLREAISKVYFEKYNTEAKIITIHAGLECGIFSDKIEGLDCISMGPTAYDIHTPEERLSIQSAVRVFEFITELIKNI